MKYHVASIARAAPRISPTLSAAGGLLGSVTVLLGGGAHAQEPPEAAASPVGSGAVLQQVDDGTKARGPDGGAGSAPADGDDANAAIDPRPAVAVTAEPPLAPAPAPTAAASPQGGAPLPDTPVDTSEPDGLARHPFVGQAYLTGGFVYGSSTNSAFRFDLAGLGFEAGASYLLGPRFPGLRGGVWNGVLLQPGLGVYAASELPRPIVATKIDAVVMVSGGLTVGYQLFGLPRIGADGRQAGLGVALGYRLAYQYNLVYAPVRGDSAHGADASHGAVLQLTLPRYYERNDHFGRILLGMEVDRLPSSAVNLAKLNIGGGF